MGNTPTHTFTWLKVLCVAHVASMLILGLVAQVGLFVLLSPWFHVILLILSLAGLGIGLAVNVISQFRKPVLFYALGHLAVLLTAISYSGISVQETKEPYPMEDISTPVPEIDGVLPAPDKLAIEKVIYLMEESYPLGTYEIGQVNTTYFNNDTTGKSGLTCSIIFTLPEENNKMYISKYFIKQDSFSVIYSKKDTLSAEYKEFKQSHHP